MHQLQCVHGAIFSLRLPDAPRTCRTRKARPATGHRILEGGAYNKLLRGQRGAYSFRRTRLPHVATCHMPLALRSLGVVAGAQAGAPNG